MAAITGLKPLKPIPAYNQPPINAAASQPILAIELLSPITTPRTLTGTSASAASNGGLAKPLKKANAIPSATVIPIAGRQLNHGTAIHPALVSDRLSEFALP